jgi:hypothetical protein
VSGIKRSPAGRDPGRQTLIVLPPALTAKIAKALGIGRASFNRVLEDLDPQSTITGGRVA